MIVSGSHRRLADAIGLMQKRKLGAVPIDGRPRFVKRSLNDGEKVKLAAIDPDFA